MADSTCSSCGKALALSDVLYNETGAIVCADCSTKTEILGDEKRAAYNIVIAGYTCLVAGIAGFLAMKFAFGLGFYVGAILSVASGIYAGKSLLGGEERFLAHLTPAQRTTTWITTGIGLAVAAYETLAFAGVIPFRLWI